MKKRIIGFTIGISSTILIVGASVGGYYSSFNANPYRSYYKNPVNDTTTAFLSAYYSSVVNGAELLLLPGFSLKPSLLAALDDPRFNSTGFLLIDECISSKETSSTSQVATVQFRVDQGSFITGIAIAMYLNEHKDYFLKDDNKLTWATYGGMNFSSVTSFMGGFQEGIKFFNEQIVTKANNNELLPVEQIYLSPEETQNFAGSFAPNGGDRLIDEFLVKKLDCLIPVAGPQAMSAVARIASKKTKRTIVIGVDSPIEEDNLYKNYMLPNDDNNKSIGPIVPFSSLKKINEMVPQMLDEINKGNSYKINSKNVGGFGCNSLGDITNNGVGVSKSGQKYFIDAMKKFTNNQQLSSYDEAVNELKKDVNFQNWDKQPIKTFSAGTGKFTFELPASGSEYERMPETQPSTFPLSSQDWNEKRNFNLNGFIKQNTQSDSNKIKIILSTATSVLLDASFSQSAYLGLWSFYKMYGINIPSIGGAN